MKFKLSDYQDYLYQHYKDRAIDSSMFMKLVEEIGEVAEVLNKRDGRKLELTYELVDMIHYIVAIASLNQIDLSEAILEKDKKTSIRYNHDMNFEQFLSKK